MLGAICQSQVAQIGQVLEEQIDLKVLELSDDQAEDLIPCSVQLLNDLSCVPRRLELLQQILNVRLNVSLLETIAMLLPLDVLVLHFVALEALFLPVKLKVDVSGGLRDGQFLIGQFHYFTLDVLVGDVSQLGVQVEVLRHNFVSKLGQVFDLIRRERF